MSSITNTSSKKPLFQGKKGFFYIAIALAVVAAAVIAVLLFRITSTTTYYVLNQDIEARTLVTEEMLSPVTVLTGSEPPTSVDAGTVAAGATYARYALSAGDTLTSSNSGALAPLTQGLPDNYTIASFSATPNFAAGGKAQRGDYVDLFVINPEDGSSHLFLQRVLIVDATIDLDSVGDTSESTTATVDEEGNPVSAGEDSVLRSGLPSLYTVGLTLQDAARLAAASQYDIYVTFTPEANVQDGSSEAEVGAGNTELFFGPAPDAGVGTDRTFGTQEEQEELSTTDSDSDSSTSEQ